MARHRTIFYSWQSDTPASHNQSFIEEALHAAIERLRTDAELIPALRDSSFEIDRDTKGVSGSPPIAQTILEKIESCSTFVADVTFVGQSLARLKRRPARLIPNPNVLIEYGYALSQLGHSRIVTIMNTSFGEPSNLPFDLRHLRWPITFHRDAANEAQRDTVFEKLVRDLAEALLATLSVETVAVEEVRVFTAQQPTQDPSIFFTDSKQLISEGVRGHEPPQVTIPDEGRVYLRLYPSTEVPPLESELAARTLASRGALRPIGLEVHGWSAARNEFGAIVYAPPEEGRLFNFTQVFLTRELWGVDAMAINSTLCRSFSPDYGKPYIPSLFVERTFAAALVNYLEFAKGFLELPLPIILHAGLTSVKGYSMAVERGFAGRALHTTIDWTGEVMSYDLLAPEILRPFFERMWQQCGLVRSEKYHQTLLNEFGTPA